MCLYYMISVQADSIKVESVVHRGQRISKMEMIVPPWSNYRYISPSWSDHGYAELRNRH